MLESDGYDVGGKERKGKFNDELFGLQVLKEYGIHESHHG